MWNRSVASNNKSNWNHLRIIQKIPEQHNGKARKQRTASDSHIGQCTHASESTKKSTKH